MQEVGVEHSVAQIPYSASLSSDNFPFLSQFKGPTVVLGQYDQNYELSINQTRLQKEKQVPEAYYLENIMPSGQGWATTGFTPRVTGLLGATDFDQGLILRDSDQNRVVFSPAKGKNYIFDANNSIWKSIGAIPLNNGMVTSAWLSGVTYVFYENTGCFTYDKDTMTFSPVAFDGIDVTKLKGLTAAQGFLIVWDDLTVYRSQLGSPTEFAPDFTLGSGSEEPQDAKGKILFCLQIPGGYIIYTTANAVGASFNINQRQPFTYKEIAGSAGVTDINQVSYHDSLGTHYAWTTSGLLKLNKDVAINVFPELSDFLAGKIYEEWDPINKALVTTKTSNSLAIKVTVVGARFLIISYGIVAGQFTMAVIYDLAFKRWGKVKINHVHCLEYLAPTISGDVFYINLGEMFYSDLGDLTYADLAEGLFTDPQAKENIGFLQADGTIVTINFDLTQQNCNGVLLLGKYQFRRNSFLVIDDIMIQNVDQANTDFDVLLLSSLNGQTIDYTTEPYLSESDDLYRRYLSEISARNHGIALIGTFHAISMELLMHEDGKV